MVAYHVTLHLIAFQLHTKTVQRSPDLLPRAGDVIHPALRNWRVWGRDYTLRMARNILEIQAMASVHMHGGSHTTYRLSALQGNIVLIHKRLSSYSIPSLTPRLY